mmetsp:Transcript_22944/g.48553  ORF Transcript_22944/g.48553 Transcript_22944/m.48553 type:complete len:84 (-) Transcript_22944:38-289(-)
MKTISRKSSSVIKFDGIDHFVTNPAQYASLKKKVSTNEIELIETSCLPRIFGVIILPWYHYIPVGNEAWHLKNQNIISYLFYL